MKTSKSLTEAEIAELPSLPDGWIWVRLGESIEVLTDGSHFSPKSIDKGYPYITVKDIKNDHIDFDNCSKISEDDYNNLVKSGCKPYKGDVLFSKDGTVGKVSLVNFEKDFVVLSSLAIIRPFANINDSNSKFLFWVFKSTHFLNQALKSKKGVAIRRIILRDLKELIIPLPPLPEQRAIVSKIEQLFSELDNGISNLKMAQEQLKVYRQAVLKKAFEGELTKKWREQQTNLPDEGELLEKIRKEREKAAKISGKKTNKIKSLTDTELAELPKLPTGWIWTALGEAIENIQAGKSIKCDERSPKSNELGIVKVSSVSWGEFNENESKTCFSEEAFNADYIIHKNDFLFSRANTIELVGACVIVKSINKRLMLSDKILKIDFLQKHNNFYSLYYLRSVFGRKEIESLATGNQESMRNIGQDRIKQIKIPICSLPEQQAIVQEIETRLSVCDKIEQDIETNLEKAEALRQSILKKAFEGKLLNEKELAEVRGAEDWEPAEVLLEKIKAERNNKGWKREK